MAAGQRRQRRVHLRASIKSAALKSGMLLQEISETIARQKQEDDGELRYQLCALIFLIGQLPHQGPADAGIRANAETLADLLVTDLNHEQCRTPQEGAGTCWRSWSLPGRSCRSTTSTGCRPGKGPSGTRRFRRPRNKLLADPGKLASERSQLLKTQCSEILKKSKLTARCQQGIPPVRTALRAGCPRRQTAARFPVWIRDGWEVEEKTVLNDARAAGDSAAVVYGFMPRNHAEEIKQAIASYYAAEDDPGSPRERPAATKASTPRRRWRPARTRPSELRDGLITDMLNEAADLPGGRRPGQRHVARQPRSKTPPSRAWTGFTPNSIWPIRPTGTRSSSGPRRATAMPWPRSATRATPKAHPVCKAILDYVGSGKKGTDIRKHFGNPPYGWPQDAIDAALIVLHTGGQVQARSGGEMIVKGKLDQKNIATAEFRVEDIKLTKVQLIAMRGLFKKVGLEHVSRTKSRSMPPSSSTGCRSWPKRPGAMPRFPSRPPRPICPTWPIESATTS